MWRVFWASTFRPPSRKPCFRGRALRARPLRSPRYAAPGACAWTCAPGCCSGTVSSSSTESRSSRLDACEDSSRVSPTSASCGRASASRSRSLGCCTVGTSPGGFASENAMSEPSAEAVPERPLLRRRGAYREGFNGLLGRGRRGLRIFDPDLWGLEMNRTSRIETLTRFLRESRTRRVYVALHDIEHVTKRCPRLIALMSSYTSALLIFQTHGEAANVQACFLLAAAHHLVPRPAGPPAPRALLLNHPKN